MKKQELDRLIAESAKARGINKTDLVAELALAHHVVAPAVWKWLRKDGGWMLPKREVSVWQFFGYELRGNELVEAGPASWETDVTEHPARKPHYGAERNHDAWRRSRGAVPPPEPIIEEPNLVPLDEVEWVQVPVMETDVAGGLPRLGEITKRQIERKRKRGPSVAVPSDVVGPGVTTVMIRVRGDSMEPDYGDGSMIIVDLEPRNPEELLNKAVVVWLPDEGATIKYLRDDAGGVNWLLMPSHLGYKPRVIPKARTDFRVYRVISVTHKVD